MLLKLLLFDSPSGTMGRYLQVHLSSLHSCDEGLYQCTLHVSREWDPLLTEAEYSNAQTRRHHQALLTYRKPKDMVWGGQSKAEPSGIVVDLLVRKRRRKVGSVGSLGVLPYGPDL